MSDASQKEVHVFLGEDFLKWAHDKLGYPTIQHTTYQLQKESHYDLGIMWEIYKGSDKPIPSIIIERKNKFMSSYKSCLICKAQLICHNFSFNKCTCDKKAKQLADKILADTESIHTKLRNSRRFNKY